MANEDENPIGYVIYPLHGLISPMLSEKYPPLGPLSDVLYVVKSAVQTLQQIFTILKT